MRFERSEKIGDVQEPARPARNLWVHQEGSVTRHKGYLCDGYDPPLYWFPGIGEPGWGTSIQLGGGAFEKREDAVAAAEGYIALQMSVLNLKQKALQ